jgi:hypothetical protein
MGRKPAHWTRVDRDYERIRIDMQTLFDDLAIDTPLAAEDSPQASHPTSPTNCRKSILKRG